MSSLREVQSAIAEALFLGDTASQSRPIDDAVTAATHSCFDVYRHNVFTSLTGAVRAVYPVIEQLVGPEFFTRAARGYVRATPSTSGDLHRFGASFPEFLAQLPGCGDLVYLPDTARLEWLMHEAFHAAEHGALDLARLADVPSERYDVLEFLLHPTCRLLASPYPVQRIWQVNQPDASDAAPVDLAEGGVHLIVARPSASVEIELISAAEFMALDALARGAQLGTAFERAQQEDPGFDPGEFLRRRVLARTLVDFRIAAAA